MSCPQVIGLVGTLGAGKTTLAQAIAGALGIDSSEVTSPTFTLLQTYDTGLPLDGPASTCGRQARRPSNHRVSRLHHFDAYRIQDSDEWLALGVEETMDDDGSITLIEWADRVADTLPPDTLWITIRLNESPDLRDLEFSGGQSEGNARLISALADLA